jgi:hypothetical protein
MDFIKTPLILRGKGWRIQYNKEELVLHSIITEKEGGVS